MHFENLQGILRSCRLAGSASNLAGWGKLQIAPPARCISRISRGSCGLAVLREVHPTLQFGNPASGPLPQDAFPNSPGDLAVLRSCGWSNMTSALVTFRAAIPPPASLIRQGPTHSREKHAIISTGSSNGLLINYRVHAFNGIRMICKGTSWDCTFCVCRKMHKPSAWHPGGMRGFLSIAQQHFCIYYIKLHLRIIYNGGMH